MIFVFIFVIGLCIGSFINMLVYRTASQYGILKRKAKRNGIASSFLPRNDVGGRSFCDYCGRQLRWYENVPVVSWMIQRGQTRCCRQKLDWGYPVVELGTGILFLNFSYQFSVTSYHFLVGLVILTMLIFSAVFDIKYMILPDFSTVILTICAIILLFFQPNPLPFLWSALGSGVFIGCLHWGTRGRGMGMGDVKLAPFMGLLLGFPKIILAYYVAFVVGSVVAVAMIIMKKVKVKSKIAFGPFLILGTMVAWWGGETIIKFLIFNF